MVRQYIGARYVTKIYENSQDPSSAEWESNVNYEPLVLVTYNNGSYLSKKEVPANVGNPAANPSYWVQTGFYNGQIADLQNQITALISAIAETYVTPEKYGAAGDGVTDDTDAFRTALTANTILVLNEDSTYLISGTITIPSGTKIYGNGATIKIADNSALTNGVFYADNVNDIFINDIVFDSNVSNQAALSISDPLYNIPVKLFQSSNIIVDNCKFTGLYTASIQVQQCDGNIELTNNVVNMGSSSFGFDGIAFHCIGNASTINLKIDHNYFTCNVLDFDHGYSAVMVGDTKGHTVISNNYIKKCGRSDAYSQPCSAVELYINVANCVITNNEFDDCYLISRIMNSHDIIVSENSINETTPHTPISGMITIFNGIYYGVPEDTYNIKVLNNSFNMVSTSLSFAMIQLSSQSNDVAPHDISIIGNHFKCAAAINIYNGSRTIKIENNIMDSSVSGSFILIYNTQDSNVTPGGLFVSHNKVNIPSGCPLNCAGLIKAASTFSYIVDNDFTFGTPISMHLPSLIQGNHLTLIGGDPSDPQAFVYYTALQAANYCYLFDNITGAGLYKPTGAQIIANRNYHDGTAY